MSDRIDDSELAYHAKVIEDVKRSREAQQQALASEAAFRSWGLHLHDKYGLEPGDRVDESGQIVRSED